MVLLANTRTACFLPLMINFAARGDKAKRFQGEEAVAGYRSQLYVFLIMLPLFLSGMEALGKRCMHVEGSEVKMQCGV